MNRRTAVMSMALLGLVACAFPQASFAQSSPFIGTWKLNLEKSKYPPGAAPRSQTLTYQQDGQNIRLTGQTIDAQGNAITNVIMHIYDGQPHPVTGNPLYDARSYTRVDANTLISASMKAGKLVVVGIIVVPQDGKTFTSTNAGIIDASGRQGTWVNVFDKQ